MNTLLGLRSRLTFGLPCCLGLLLGACAPPAPPPPAPSPPAPEPVFAYDAVWTARAGVALQVDDSTALAIAHPLTRLAVLSAEAAAPGVGSPQLRVRCVGCRPRGQPAPEGTVRLEDVLYEPEPLADAAASDLARFGLSLRQALQARDLPALRSVMSPHFSFAFVGPRGPDAALRAWSAVALAPLEEAAALLDRGLASRDGSLWAAPPEFFETLEYQGLRLGVQRTPDDRWEWVFLIRGEATSSR